MKVIQIATCQAMPRRSSAYADTDEAVTGRSEASRTRTATSPAKRWRPRPPSATTFTMPDTPERLPAVACASSRADD